VSDYEVRQKRRNIVVGLFVIISIIALIWLLFKFQDLPMFVSNIDSYEVYVQFPTAPGVEQDTPVQFCGYQIGRVTRVQAPEARKDLKTGEKYYQIVVVLSINKQYSTIPSNVEVKMMMRGLGSSYIELKQRPGLPIVPLEPNQPATKFLFQGALLQGSTGMTSEFFPEESQEKLSELIDGITALVDNANKIIGNTDNQTNLQTTLANLTTVTEQAKSTLKAIEKLADSGTTTFAHTDAKMDEIVNAANDTSKDIREFVNTGTDLLKKTDERSDKVAEAVIDTVEELGKASSQLRLIMEKINSGQGTVAKFLNDPLLYDKLVKDTEQLDEVLTTMKALVNKIQESGLSKVWSGSK
jgi:phospholipid/cholesterol/gamma-HCH transport system substrate-binding protein